jgi:hypothetical protein
MQKSSLTAAMLMRVLLVPAALIVALPGAPAFAQAPEKQTAAPVETPRYTMHPVPGGVMRLDTRLGLMSLCVSKESTFVCRPVADERSATDDELARLMKENMELKEKLAALQKNGNGTFPALPRFTPPKALTLPDEQEMDRAMTLLEKMMRRFITIMREEGQAPDKT